MIFFTPFIILFFTEVLKVIIKSIKNKKLQLKWFLHAGGMPSGHSSFTASIATLATYIKGFNSIEFLIASGFALLIMYDARGVRATVGKHAKLINSLYKEYHLDESIGHTNLQVFIGACIGIGLTIICIKVFGYLGFQI